MEHSLEAISRAISRASDQRTIYLTPENMRDSLGDKEVVCATHGTYTSSGARYMGKREIWTRCPSCDEAEIAAARQEEATRKADQERKKLELHIQAAAIPARFIGRSLENFCAETTEQKRALSISREFVAQFGSKGHRGDSLIFLGAPGTGKSHLATAIIQALLPKECGLYLTTSGLIRAVRSTWRKDSEHSETEVLKEFSNVPMLVIDEIGVQYGTDSEQNILFEVLDRRYREMRSTILLANLRLKREKPEDLAGLREVLGERIYDRLTETARIVTFEGESYRIRARAEAV